MAIEGERWYSVGETSAGIREIEAQIRVIQEILIGID
jgi:hypothetical protein